MTQRILWRWHGTKVLRQVGLFAGIALIGFTFACGDESEVSADGVQSATITGPEETVSLVTSDEGGDQPSVETDLKIPDAPPAGETETPDTVATGPTEPETPATEPETTAAEPVASPETPTCGLTSGPINRFPDFQLESAVRLDLPSIFGPLVMRVIGLKYNGCCASGQTAPG
jgi:hypothetical protein